MRSRAPATPAELTQLAYIYRRVVTGPRGDHGQEQTEYHFRQRSKWKTTRQKASDDTIAHQMMAVFASALVGNWWEVQRLGKDDIIVFVENGYHMGIVGVPINWEGRNRWGIVQVSAIDICEVGSDCVCHSRQMIPPVGQS